jgi:hypothetical protein
MGEEYKLRMFQNKVLRRMGLLEPNREHVTRGWRKLHEEELNNF